ncbi:MAG: pro-sigmaK processing inhibitor BofA family protein [Oscillospiraceae bacterium]|nr:pro-sigmaK processing inhibitor BofA family protein [Oscillospiraceae bacterium]
MGLTEKIVIGALCAFAALGVIRLFSAPLRLALKVLLNTLLGFAALFLLNQASPLTGFSLGLNLFNALIIGILGVPGLVLLALLKLVFV